MGRVSRPIYTIVCEVSDQSTRTVLAKLWLPHLKYGKGTTSMKFQIISTSLLLISTALLAVGLLAQTSENPALLPQRDGSHDFDFLIGDWKAHVRRLPDRLNNSNVWDVYDGISNHHKLLDSNANFEQFEVTSTDKKLHIKAQTLRLYNPTTRQWSIYLVDLDNGTLDTPPVVGAFTGKRGEFYHQEILKGRTILVRYVWLDLSPTSSRMEQSYSPDGGKSWEVNWICELSR
jgi:hypothetical protein